LTIDNLSQNEANGESLAKPLFSFDTTAPAMKSAFLSGYSDEEARSVFGSHLSSQPGTHAKHRALLHAMKSIPSTTVRQPSGGQ
jgi:hypothetical protein